jgi:hypothetical protein
MKIKVRIKHLKIKKCLGQEFIDSQLKGIDKYDKCDLIWSHTFKMPNLSLFLLENNEIVEKKYFIYHYVRRTLYYCRN